MSKNKHFFFFFVLLTKKIWILLIFLLIINYIGLVIKYELVLNVIRKNYFNKMKRPEIITIKVISKVIFTHVN